MCSTRRRISYRSATRQRRRKARRRLRGNMLCMADLRVGTRLRISAPGLGACIGRVEAIERPAAGLPDYGLPGVAEAAHEILTEWGVSRVAAISYHASPAAE